MIALVHTCVHFPVSWQGSLPLPPSISRPFGPINLYRSSEWNLLLNARRTAKGKHQKLRWRPKSESGYS